MIVVRCLFLLIVFLWLTMICCLLYLDLNKKRIINTLWEMNFKALSLEANSILSKYTFAPARGTAPADIKRWSNCWKNIAKINSSNVFLKRVTYLLKAIRLIKLFLIFFGTASLLILVILFILL